MPDHRTILFDHVMRTAQQEPVAVRSNLYRALAEYAGNPDQTDQLLKLAAELEAVDQRCFAFARQLRQAPLFTETTNGGLGR